MDFQICVTKVAVCFLGQDVVIQVNRSRPIWSGQDRPDFAAAAGGARCDLRRSLVRLISSEISAVLLPSGWFRISSSRFLSAESRASSRRSSGPDTDLLRSSEIEEYESTPCGRSMLASCHRFMYSESRRRASRTSSQVALDRSSGSCRTTAWHRTVAVGGVSSLSRRSMLDAGSRTRVPRPCRSPRYPLWPC